MIVTCGEALVDLIPEPGDGGTLYRPVPGGSLYTLALGIARLGGDVGYLWELSRDSLGAGLVEGLAAAGVATGPTRRGDRATPVAVVDMSGPEPRYNIADPDKVMDETDPGVLPAGARCLAIGSAVLAREPVARAIEALAATAPLVAIDYNCRPPSIADPAGYKARLRRLAVRGSIVKASSADLDILGEADHAAYMAGLVAEGAALAVLTRAEAGAAAWSRRASAEAPSLAARVVDAVGAGDAFMAGLLAHLQAEGALDGTRLEALDHAELRRLLDAAQRVAAVTLGHRGAVMPRREDLGVEA